jgi:hypothetical protein
MPVWAKGNVYSYKVAVKLERVERIPLVERNIIVIDGQYCSDGLISSTWAVTPEGIGLALQNLKDTEMNMVWQNCWFFDEKRKKQPLRKRLLTGGFNEKHSKPQLTKIPAKGKLNAVFYPRDYIKSLGPLVRFGSTHDQFLRKSVMRGVQKTPIFKETYSQKDIKKIMKKQKSKSRGSFDFASYINDKTYVITLDLKIDDRKYTYHFHFRSHVQKD